MGDRDFIFYVENSHSMHNHFQQIEKCLQVYAYIIKGIDKNGFEVVFASNPTNVTKHTTSTSFKELFCKQDWTQANAEDKFGTFVDEVIMQRLPARWKRGILRPKKLSVFVLTDGRWGNISSQACGMQRPIQKLIYKMKERGVEAHRTQVSIQFMRFGDEEAGIRYLDYLDQMGKAQDMYV